MFTRASARDGQPGVEKELVEVGIRSEADVAAKDWAGMRMYLKYASERQRPKVWIRESCRPAWAAADAAPMR